MTRPQHPAPDTVRADDDWPADLDSAPNVSSSESPLFLDEADAGGSSLFVETKSPVFHSGPAGIIGPTPYREHRGRLPVRAARRVLKSAVTAGQGTVHALYRSTDFIAAVASGVFQRAHACARFCAQRLPIRKGIAPVSLRSRVRGRGTIADAALATLVLGVLAYVARPAPSASRDVSTTASRADVAGTVSRQATSAAVAPVNLVATGKLAATASVTRRASENSSVRVPPAAATTGSRRVATPPATARPVASGPSFVGALRVTSQPAGAEVSLNGVPQGRTPLTIKRVRAGSRVVSLSLPGYERWSWSVAVVADRQTPIAVKLQADHRRSGGDPE
jgi:hypothetical protein